MEDEATSTRDAFRRAQLGGPARRGLSPAVVVVDLQRGFTDPTHPLGGDCDGVIASTGRLLEVARANGQPVVFSVIAYEPDEHVAWFDKMPQLSSLRAGTPWCELDPRLRRRADEKLVVKRAASVAFGTDLVEHLSHLGVDTVLVVGVTTSGCVRATAVDLVSSGFSVLVPEEAVGDRAVGPHTASLVDIAAKYGDVVPVDEAISYLREAAS